MWSGHLSCVGPGTQTCRLSFLTIKHAAERTLCEPGISRYIISVFRGKEGYIARLCFKTTIVLVIIIVYMVK